MEVLKNKKVIATICAVVFLVVLSIIFTIFFTKPSYKDQISEFVNGMNNAEQMNKFVERRVDIKAIYAMEKTEEDKDIDQKDKEEVKKTFEKNYKEAKKSDYESEEFKNKVKDFYDLMTGFNKKNGEKVTIELKEVGKAEDFEELTAFKQVPFTISIKNKDNSEDVEFMAVFYKGRFVMVTISEEDEN